MYNVIVIIKLYYIRIYLRASLIFYRPLPQRARIKKEIPRAHKHTRTGTQSTKTEEIIRVNNDFFNISLFLSICSC
jgi:hypothetical protein